MFLHNMIILDIAILRKSTRFGKLQIHLMADSMKIKRLNDPQSQYLFEQLEQKKKINMA